MIYEKHDPVRLTDDDNAILAIDQTLLPNRVAFIRLENIEQVYEAIKTLQVRGAPCIGICAAYGLYIAAKQFAGECESKEIFFSKLHDAGKYLNSARPTAVNLSWALKHVQRTAANNMRKSFDEILDKMKTEAVRIHENDIKTCRTISEYGLSLVKDGDGILTHCNAGALATSRYGTGLGPLLLGAERNMNFHAYVDETRPLLQGARLTSFELSNAGIDTTLICDNMASLVMREGKINACFVGCDRVAKNGDTANKIGTSGVAVLAKYYNIPFYVFCPTSTIDVDCTTGDDIVIEERDGDEIKLGFFKEPIAPQNVKCYNPAFDITSHELITAIITEKGIFYPPYNFEEI